MANAPSFRAFLIGADSLLLECGDILIDKGHQILGVVTAAQKVRAWAEQRKLRVVSFADYKAVLAQEPFDYLFAITHLAILPDDVVALPRVAAINFHDGPLPRYAGLNTPAWALMHGEREYGISWHEIRGGVDEGDILKQRLFEIAPGETSVSLNTRNFAAAIDSFAELVDELSTNSVQRTRQDLSQRSYFSKYQRPPAAATLDFRRPAQELVAGVRGLDFGEYENALGLPRIYHAGKLLLVRSAEVRDDGADAANAANQHEPGTVLSIGDDAMEIATGVGTLRVLEVSQPCGTRLPLTAAAEKLGLTPGSVIAPLSQALAERLSARVEAAARSESFWVERLITLEPSTLALAQAERAAAASAPAVVLPLEVPAAFTSDPGRVFGSVLAGFALYLARTTGKASFDVGYRDLRREEYGAELAPWFGMQVPLRIALDESASFADTRAVIEKELGLVGKKAPFQRDLAARYPGLKQRSELASGELAQVAVLHGADQPVGELPPGALAALSWSERGGFSLLCDSGALSERSRKSFVHQLQVLLSAAAAEPTRAVGELSLLSPEDEAQLRDWNSTARPAPDACVHSLFEAQVARTPDRVAAIFEDESLSYRELDARANQVAATLRASGVGPETIVGVNVERGLQLVIATLGVLKAGGAYLPLDPNYPQDRLLYMIEDSGTKVVLTEPALMPQLPAGIKPIDIHLAAKSGASSSAPVAVSPQQLAYVIYTSGSTGKPKGVMVEHRNVANFFVGMDDVVPHDQGGTWLSVTSLSFDISVLELFWTLSRGLSVVVYRDRAREGSEASAAPKKPARSARTRPLDFSLFLWGAQDTRSANTYQLMLEAARFGDSHGFSAIWTPERHFHAFGGPYPNPSVTGSALAAVTQRMQIRAGSCVVTLHHPARVAEEWAVVDNISGGRVGISFASGWQPDDFLLYPSRFKDNKKIMLELIDQVRRLWRGEELGFPGPLGNEVKIRTQPRPIQAELPFWVTAAGHPDTFKLAGSSGANILTHLLGQSVDEVAEKIAIYRKARAEAGHDPQTGIVTLMLHTYLGQSVDEVRELVRQPMKEYLRSSVNLIKNFAWAFPAFKRPAGQSPGANDLDIGGLATEELDAVLDFAFERYFESSGLFGTPDSCLEIISKLEAIGVDDVACLIDFGVPTAQVLEGLAVLDQLRERAQAPARLAPQAANDSSTSEDPAERFALPAQIRRHKVTHMQCTPSMMRMSRVDDDGKAAIDSVAHLMVGGEAFPLNLAQELSTHTGTVTNMYGPTETTVWSATHRLRGPDAVPIGKPIANTQLYVLDAQRRPVPVGVPGELWIAGAGVVRGYLNRPELTEERFLRDPFAGEHARMYRTGDLVRWSATGVIEFLGRTDHQVKVRGYRIELGEIESLVLRQSGVLEAVVIAREDSPGDVRLVAYYTGTADENALRDDARAKLPEYMVPSAFVLLEQFPQTPNGKIDRKALPAPEALGKKTAREYVAPESDLEAKLVALWCEVLAVERVGIEDNFFDIGGHSLLVVKLHRRIKADVSNAVALTDLYRFPTVRSLVSKLTGAGANVAVEEGQGRAAARMERLSARRDMASRRRR